VSRAANSTLVATAAALTGFAANSLLCRMALGAGAIDAWTFTAVRLGSGAIVLLLLARARTGAQPLLRAGSWPSALALLVYAAAFSLAYLRVNTGIGALVLFASVQATMIGWSLWRGARPSRAEWLGLAIAFGGLVVLARPGDAAPDAVGLLLMAAAGAAWGVYTLRGRNATSPLAATADNFARAAPFALAGLALKLPVASASARGVTLALASGILASGLGYTLWYTALPRLSATRAAILQLLVPILAAIGGIVMLGENPTQRLAIAGAMILGGVGIAVAGRRR
jgi:drug/metabolite transporter (DMT)-like permease